MSVFYWIITYFYWSTTNNTASDLHANRSGSSLYTQTLIGCFLYHLMNGTVQCHINLQIYFGLLVVSVRLERQLCWLVQGQVQGRHVSFMLLLVAKA